MTIIVAVAIAMNEHDGCRDPIRLVETHPFPWGIGFVCTTIDDRPVYAALKWAVVEGDERAAQAPVKIGVSICSGCAVGCRYCFTRTLPDDGYRPLTCSEIEAQVELVSEWARQHQSSVLDWAAVGGWKCSFKQMGDPLITATNVLNALVALARRAPDMQFVVSTVGPRTAAAASFFEQLRTLVTRGLRLRLQFSLHTSSDTARCALSPRLPMLRLAELGAEAERWWRCCTGTAAALADPQVTLTVVPMEGVRFDVGELAQHFNPEHVIVKLSYLDPNPATDAEGFEDAPAATVGAIEQALAAAGFRSVYRFGGFSRQD